MFQVTESEWEILRSQNVTLKGNSLRSQNAILENTLINHIYAL